MKALGFQTIASMCGGELLQGDASGVATSVSTDTRTIGEGALYVALEGERFDGHRFVRQAVLNGAAGVMVSREPEGGFPEGVVVLRVDDTLAGLQNLAREYRRAVAPVGVAVTGSSGKTSTKDMIAAVLGVKYNVRATRGNLNNHIGLPLTLLSHEEGESVGVWEMGMNSPGEIAVLAEIAKPEIGVVTNVGSAHLERMGTQRAIAAEKGALVEALAEDGCAVLNANDEWTKVIEEKTVATVLLAGIDAGEVRATAVESTGTGSRFGLEY
ncbi:MAG: UDP-N-acetylmuramoyl-tripeptide--D-alanyl-D-alanine ligase, partial [Verrucomicrobiales bacterium]|nr:UDP-N-acetylmuramoyl-tripeptide--D-alanyl-D-alanine ligase [Verrucomicrobiales bacterium]